MHVCVCARVCVFRTLKTGRFFDFRSRDSRYLAPCVSHIWAIHHLFSPFVFHMRRVYPCYFIGYMLYGSQMIPYRIVQIGSGNIAADDMNGRANGKRIKNDGKHLVFQMDFSYFVVLGVCVCVCAPFFSLLFSTLKLAFKLRGPHSSRSHICTVVECWLFVNRCDTMRTQDSKSSCERKF